MFQNDFDYTVMDQVGHRPYPMPQTPYCLYTFDDAFHGHRAEIHHGPWTLSLGEAEFDVNTMAEANGIRLPAVSPLAHFAKRQDTVIWPLSRA
jgi:hypothetical protein